MNLPLEYPSSLRSSDFRDRGRGSFVPGSPQQNAPTERHHQEELAEAQAEGHGELVYDRLSVHAPAQPIVMRIIIISSIMMMIIMISIIMSIITMIGHCWLLVLLA